MAQTRLEKIGTIFSRVTGLMKAGSMRRADRPLWYDVYEAFPPEMEPRFDRPASVVPVRPILYPEDAIRARFQRQYGAPGTLRLRASSAAVAGSLCDQVVERCGQLHRSSPHLSDEEAFTGAVDSLRAEGVPIGGPVEMATSSLQQVEESTGATRKIDVSGIMMDTGDTPSSNQSR